MQTTRRAINTMVAALSLCGAVSAMPPPFAGERWALDQALRAVSVERSRSAALETLQDVAEGKPKETVIAAALRAGLDAFVARPDFMFGDASVRSYAMDRIGASGLPEAIEYLRSMTTARVGPDSTETIYPAAQVALYKALLRQETDPERQVAFLEQQLTKPPVARWLSGP